MWNDAIVVPADLRLMISRNRIQLISGDRLVTIDNNPDSGPFSSGPVLLSEFYERHVLPSLARLISGQTDGVARPQLSKEGWTLFCLEESPALTGNFFRVKLARKLRDAVSAMGYTEFRAPSLPAIGSVWLIDGVRIWDAPEDRTSTLAQLWAKDLPKA